MLIHVWQSQSHSSEMHFVWTSPWRALLVFPVDVHSATIRLSCSVCGNLVLANITMWTGDPPASGTHFQVLTTQFFQHHCPKKTSGQPNSRFFLSCSGDTRNAESILKPSKLVTDQPTIEVSFLETELQSFNCLHKISVSFPSSTTKEENLVTSWGANKFRC